MEIGTINLHGIYGSKFKYYGKAVPFSVGVESYWEVYVFDLNKQFKVDGFLNSEDCRAKLSGPLLNIPISSDLFKKLAAFQAEQSICEMGNVGGMQTCSA
jgi:hypothetical protein